MSIYYVHFCFFLSVCRLNGMQYEIKIMKSEHYFNVTVSLEILLWRESCPNSFERLSDLGCPVTACRRKCVLDHWFLQSFEIVFFNLHCLLLRHLTIYIFIDKKSGYGSMPGLWVTSILDVLFPQTLLLFIFSYESSGSLTAG